MASIGLIYHDNQKKIWQLAKSRKLVCYTMQHYYKNPWITLRNLEKGECIAEEGSPELRIAEEGSPELRVYASEFDALKKVILEFCDYLQGAGKPYYNEHKASELVATDSDTASRRVSDRFMIDLSRSLTWLLVRFNKGSSSVDMPMTVMEKEKNFPIYLAFHLLDIGTVRKLLKEFDTYFDKQRETVRKMTLLEKRFTNAGPLSGDESEEEMESPRKKPRRVQLITISSITSSGLEVDGDQVDHA